MSSEAVSLNNQAFTSTLDEKYFSEPSGMLLHLFGMHWRHQGK